MAELFVYRSLAREEARRKGYKGFRTRLDDSSQMWKLYYEPGDVSPAHEWAQGKDFVAWTEIAWDDGDPPKRLGVLIVSVTPPELADLEIPADFKIEPLTPELFEPQRKSPQTATGGATRARPYVAPSNDGPRPTRARSDVESPTKLVWRIADEMPGASRADVVARCIELGVNKATASTQYYRWAKAKEVD